MSLCNHCVQGVRHEGTPEGNYETIGGIKTYVATPPGDYSKDKAILFLTDIFGLELDNNILLADDFARNGFKTYFPDIFNGENVPAEEISPIGSLKGNFDIKGWLPTHGADVTQPRVEAVIEALKLQGITRFGAVGYCYGARLAFNLAFEQKVNVVVVNHPSMLEVSDLEKYAKMASAPLLMNTCEVDHAFPHEKQAKADEILGGGKFKPGYKRTYWPSAIHGFAVRGDLSNPKIKEAKEGAFSAGIEWFVEHL